MDSETALKEWCFKFKGECDRIEEFFLEKLNELIIQFVERQLTFRKKLRKQQKDHAKDREKKEKDKKKDKNKKKKDKEVVEEMKN